MREPTSLLIITFFIFWCFVKMLTPYHPFHMPEMTSSQKRGQNILDGCHHVYLDVGSNIGVQIRKLFEPEKFPNAGIHSFFQKSFGSIEKRRKWQKELPRDHFFLLSFCGTFFWFSIIHALSCRGDRI